MDVTGRPHRFKSSAALLAVFLGDFGAHNLCLSQRVRGVVHLFLVAYVAALLVLAVNGLWPWGEFVIIVVTPEHRLGR